MSRQANIHAASERTTTITARRAVIVVVVAALCSVLFGTASGVHDTPRSRSEAVSAAHSQPSLPVVGRTLVSTRFMAPVRAIKHRGSALDALALAASAPALFANFRRRTDESIGLHLRFDAVFALRRGPPILPVAH
jgi:hypothetical protein